MAELSIEIFKKEMDFLLFLNQNEIEIVNIVNKAGYSIEENTPLCLLGKEYLGFFKKEQKRIVICTDNSKMYGGYLFNKINKNVFYDKTGIYIRRALRHEAVHVAQDCNDGKLLKMDKDDYSEINPFKINALRGSLRLSGNEQREYQAYSLEDKPKIIIKSLRKYCL